MIELIYRETCPYSQKVLAYIEQHGIENQLELKDINQEPVILDRLQSLTGKTQVPCLVIDGKPMLESSDIINWLKENVAGGKTGANKSSPTIQ